MLFRCAGVIAINPNTDQTEIVKSATGTVHLNENWETPVEVHDVNGFAMTTLNTTVEGLFSDFYIEDQPVVGFKTSSGHRFYLRSSTPVPGPAGPAPVSVGAAAGAFTFEYPDGTVIGGPNIPNAEVLGDATIANLLGSADTASGKAVQVRVADAVAADSTVAQAAAAAVDTEIMGRNILEGGATGELAFAVVDEDGLRTDLELDGAGHITERVMNAWKERLGNISGSPSLPPAVLVYPTPDWAHFGDSLTAANWGQLYMAPLTGRDHYNGGWGGQITDQIAARQGGVPALFTATNNTIPASGAVILTNVRRTPLSSGGNRRGSFMSVTGVLALSTGGVYTFTRDAAGEALAMPPGTPFIPEDGEKYRDRIQTIWAGRNGYKTEDPLMIVASIQQMIDYQSSAVKRVIVMEVPPWVGEETTGTGWGRPRLDALNAELRAAFRPYWLPIATWLRTEEAATFAGITFTADDQTDITNGLTPRSLRSDAGHLNDAGNLAVAKRVHLEAQNRGWL